MPRLPSLSDFPRVKKTLVYFATHYTGVFIVVMAITLVSCAFSIHYLSALEADLADIYENDVRGGDAIQTAETALLAIEGAVKDLMLVSDREGQARTQAEIQARTAVLKTSVTNSAYRFYTPKAKAAYQGTKDDLKAYLAALQSTVAGPDAGRSVDAKALARLEARADTLEKDFDLLIANRTANSSRGIAELVSQLRFSLIFTIVILVGTVVVRIGLYWAGHPGRKKGN
jgi:hypothetical protein